MYQWHEVLSTPSKSKTIWRYMSLAKYIDLLHRKKLFLSRIDRFDDPYEGQWTNAWKEYSSFHLDLDGENGLINTMFNKQYFISCWHLSEHESVAIWKIYCSESDGIAIKSTIGKIIKSLSVDQEQQIHIGVVEYIDDHSKYENKEIPTNYWGGLGEICKKRKCFSYENEVRIIEDNFSNKSEYSYANLDLQFIEEIRLAPRMSEMFIDAVKELSAKFGVSADLIKKSSIYDYPA